MNHPIANEIEFADRTMHFVPGQAVVAWAYSQVPLTGKLSRPLANR